MVSTPVQRLLAVTLVGLLAAIAVVVLSGRETASTKADTSNSTFDGPAMPPNVHAANFSLRDEFGHRVTLSQYRGRVVVLTFIHSLCKDACPFMTEQIKGALNSLPEQGRAVPAIGISVEPAQDTARNRLRFLADHHMVGRLAFLNGSRATLRRVWHAYAIAPVSRSSGHSTYVLLIDKRGLERVGIPADQLTPEGLTHDIRALEHEPA